MSRKKSTNRGFGVYAEGEDVNGFEITVSQSSLATDDAVRIYCENPEGVKVKDHKGEEVTLPDCIHVNVKGAKTIIDGLQRWLKEVTNE